MLGSLVSIIPVPANEPMLISVMVVGIVVPRQPYISLLESVSIIALQLSRESYFGLFSSTEISANL